MHILASCPDKISRLLRERFFSPKMKIHGNIDKLILNLLVLGGSILIFGEKNWINFTPHTKTHTKLSLTLHLANLTIIIS